LPLESKIGVGARPLLTLPRAEDRKNGKAKKIKQKKING